MTLFRKTLTTPVGRMELVATEKTVVALDWNASGSWKAARPSRNSTETCALLEEAEKQLREYFARQRRKFDLPLEFQGTPFQMRVWTALRKIPYGETWSYLDLARAVGNPAAMRAVGSANGKNPLSIFIPCHRVIRHSGEMGGYGGGVERKKILLDLEKRVG